MVRGLTASVKIIEDEMVTVFKMAARLTLVFGSFFVSTVVCFVQ